MSNPTRCAACRFLRRRCPQDCVLAPYFPPSNPERFACVHKIFGASNITKMLQQLPVHLREAAADCMFHEASLRVEDPTYGCVKIISQLQHDIFQAQCELDKTKGEIAFYNAQQQQQQQVHQQQQQMAQYGVNYQQDLHSTQPSWLNDNPFYSLDVQNLTNNTEFQP